MMMSSSRNNALSIDDARGGRAAGAEIAAGSGSGSYVPTPTTRCLNGSNHATRAREVQVDV